MGSNPIVNELLCYCWHYRNTCNSQSIECTTFNYYTEEEVLETKRLVFKVSKNIDDFSARKDCKSHVGKMKNICDIMKELKSIDEDGNIVANFVACNLDRLPKFSPDDQENQNLITSVNLLRAEMSSMRSDMSSLCSEVDVLKSKSTNTHATAVKSVATKPTTSPVVCAAAAVTDTSAPMTVKSSAAVPIVETFAAKVKALG